MNETQNTAATVESQPVAPTSHKGAILTGAALLGGAALFAKPRAAHAQNKPRITVNEANFGTKSNDFLVLNFALALEALETELYVQALQRLTTGGSGGDFALPGTRIQGLGLSASKASVDYLTDFGDVELAHRNFFLGALGDNAITAPGKALEGVKFDFGFGGSNNPSEAKVVQQVFQAEALGVQAYTGAIGNSASNSLFSSPSSIYLQTAAAIEGTEARHTAVVRAILNGLTGSDKPVAPLFDDNDGRETPLAPQAVINAVRPFIFLRGEAGNTDSDN